LSSEELSVKVSPASAEPQWCKADIIHFSLVSKTFLRWS
jgi:hypothetical protein